MNLISAVAVDFTVEGFLGDCLASGVSRVLSIGFSV